MRLKTRSLTKMKLYLLSCQLGVVVEVQVDLEERYVTVDRESCRMRNLQTKILRILPMHQEFSRVQQLCLRRYHLYNLYFSRELRI